jgi:2-aminoethylphosphonate transport system ATP-binding protein
MLSELARLHRELPSLTVLYVTHDQTEALTLADRIAIMRGGKLMAEGLSHVLYRNPPNRFAAEFLGRANLLPVQLEQPGIDTGLVPVRHGETRLQAMAPREKLPGTQALLCVRPHALTLTRSDVTDNAVAGTVRTVQWQGDLHNIELDVMGSPLRMVCTPLRDPPQPGSPVTLHFPPDEATLIPADAE